MTDKLRLKVLPRGKADFRTIRERGMAVVDKTQFIELVENCGADYVRIVRPRRFGKSLSVNMLEAYYDLNFPKNLHSNTGTGDYFPKKVISS